MAKFTKRMPLAIRLADGGCHQTAYDVGLGAAGARAGESAALPAAEAGRLNDRIHLVRTPKHGSWLNVAELEFSALHRQCLDRRIESRTLVTSETTAWAEERNREQTGLDWQLIVDDARTKLKHLYPKIKTGYTTRRTYVDTITNRFSVNPALPFRRSLICAVMVL